MTYERKVRLPVGYVEGGKNYREVVLRPLTGRALLEVRSKIGERVDPSLFTDILRFTVVRVEGCPEPFKPEQMFFVDADFVFYELARWDHEMMGEPMRVHRRCMECGQAVKFELKEENITVRMLEDTEWGKYPDLMIPFRLRVPITTLDPDGTPYDTGKLRLLTLGDEVEKFKRFGDAPGRLWAETVRLMIGQLGPKPYGAIFTADLEALPAFELRRIEAIYAQNLPGVIAPTELVCPACLRSSAVQPAIMWVPDFLLLPSGGSAWPSSSGA